MGLVCHLVSQGLTGLNSNNSWPKLSKVSTWVFSIRWDALVSSARKSGNADGPTHAMWGKLGRWNELSIELRRWAIVSISAVRSAAGRLLLGRRWLSLVDSHQGAIFHPYRANPIGFGLEYEFESLLLPSLKVCLLTSPQVWRATSQEHTTLWPVWLKQTDNNWLMTTSCSCPVTKIYR